MRSGDPPVRSYSLFNVLVFRTEKDTEVRLPPQVVDKTGLSRFTTVSPSPVPTSGIGNEDAGEKTPSRRWNKSDLYILKISEQVGEVE